MLSFFIGAVLGAGINELLNREKKGKYRLALAEKDQPKLSYMLTKRDENGHMITEHILSAEGERIVNEACIELLPIFMANGYGWHTMKSDSLWYDKKRVHNVILNTNKGIIIWNSTNISNVEDDFIGHVGDLIFIDLSFEKAYITTMVYFYDIQKGEYRYIGESKNNKFVKGDFVIDYSN